MEWNKPGRGRRLHWLHSLKKKTQMNRYWWTDLRRHGIKKIFRYRCSALTLWPSGQWWATKWYVHWFSGLDHPEVVANGGIYVWKRETQLGYPTAVFDTACQWCQHWLPGNVWLPNAYEMTPTEFYSNGGELNLITTSFTEGSLTKDLRMNESAA